MSRRRTYRCRQCGNKFQQDRTSSLPLKERICPMCRDKDKPCNDCTRNLEEAIFYDAISCYRHCKDFKEWRTRKIR